MAVARRLLRPRHMRPSSHARAAALLFFGQAAFAVLHRATGARYPGFTWGHDVVIDCGLAAIWTAAGLAGLLLRPRAGYFAMIAGTGLSVIHGVLFSVATYRTGPHGLGLPFLVAAVVEAYFVVHAAPAFRTPAEERANRAAAGAAEALPRARRSKPSTRVRSSA